MVRYLASKKSPLNPQAWRSMRDTYLVEVCGGISRAKEGHCLGAQIGNKANWGLSVFFVIYIIMHIYIYMYVYIYICMYIYIYMYVYIYIYNWIRHLCMFSGPSVWDRKGTAMCGMYSPDFWGQTQQWKGPQFQGFLKTLYLTWN